MLTLTGSWGRLFLNSQSCCCSRVFLPLNYSRSSVIWGRHFITCSLHIEISLILNRSIIAAYTHLVLRCTWSRICNRSPTLRVRSGLWTYELGRNTSKAWFRPSDRFSITRWVMCLRFTRAWLTDVSRLPVSTRPMIHHWLLTLRHIIAFHFNRSIVLWIVNKGLPFGPSCWSLLIHSLLLITLWCAMYWLPNHVRSDRFIIVLIAGRSFLHNWASNRGATTWYVTSSTRLKLDPVFEHATFSKVC